MPSLEAQLRAIKAGGFAGVELAVPPAAPACRAARQLLDDLGLAILIAIPLLFTSAFAAEPAPAADQNAAANLYVGRPTKPSDPLALHIHRAFGNLKT